MTQPTCFITNSTGADIFLGIGALLILSCVIWIFVELSGRGMD